MFGEMCNAYTIFVLKHKGKWPSWLADGREKLWILKQYGIRLWTQFILLRT